MNETVESDGDGRRRRLSRRRALAALFGPAALLLTGCQAGNIAAAATAGATKAASPSATPTRTPTRAPTPAAPRVRLFVPGTTKGVTHPAPPPGPEFASCTDPLSTVNRQNGLAPDCVPPNLVPLPDDVVYLVDDPELLVRDFVRDAFIEMVDAGRHQGYDLLARSAWRSYERQGELFEYWVSVLGFEEANRTSARAGHSEHQLGTAIDVTSASNNYELDGFENTPEGWWVAENAWRFGFNLSYPQGKEHITGYAFEPWHLRFVGRETANLLRTSGLTLSQFLGI